MSLPSVEFLRKTFKYDPKSGELTWAIKARKIWPGKTAGSPHNKGYLQVRVPGEASPKLVHRLVWKMVFGEEPNGQIDHKNGVRTDNRIKNLRIVTPTWNAQNVVAPTSTSTSGFRGVSYHRQSNRWRASMRVDGKQVSLGLFDTPESAFSAYISAKESRHDGVAAERMSQARNAQWGAK